jgi:hypothetical protein
VAQHLPPHAVVVVAICAGDLCVFVFKMQNGTYNDYE